MSCAMSNLSHPYVVTNWQRRIHPKTRQSCVWFSVSERGRCDTRIAIKSSGIQQCKSTWGIALYLFFSFTTFSLWLFILPLGEDAAPFLPPHVHIKHKAYGEHRKKKGSIGLWGLYPLRCTRKMCLTHHCDAREGEAFVKRQPFPHRTRQP